MKTPVKVRVLKKALEDIRTETFHPYKPERNVSCPMAEKIASWAKIQAVASKALRDIEQ